jgi:hypothetical protein
MVEELGQKNKNAFCRWSMIIGFVAMVIFACHASTHMVGAGDTWVAMACGRHFVNNGVDTVEPFSANSHKPGPTAEEIEKWPATGRWIADLVGIETVQKWHPTGWVNQNWLTHVIFYKLATWFGSEDEPHFNALVYWKFAVYLLTIACVYFIGRIFGAGCALASVFACFALFTGRSYFDIRPAGFSNLLVGVYLLILALTTYRNVLYIWLIVPLVVFWCNVHGGYVYAFIMLAPFFVLNLPGLAAPNYFITIGKKGLIHTVYAGFTALVCSIVFNPFHFTNFTHTFVISLSKHAERWRTVNEWHPAFEWSNPVGTAFPFLIMVILTGVILVLWPLSRLMLPRVTEAPRKELESQENAYKFLRGFFGYFVTVSMIVTAFLSASIINLDPVSFLLCIVFATIIFFAVRKNIFIILLQIPVILLALLATKSQSGHVGIYIYPFVLIPTYAAVAVINGIVKKEQPLRAMNLGIAALTAVVIFVLMVLIFDPCNLSLKHILDYLSLKRPWHPQYERNLEIHYPYYFKVIFILNIVMAAIYLTSNYWKNAVLGKGAGNSDKPEGPVTRQKIDLAMGAIAILTIYMAIKSRRFIPIAAIAACPVIGALVQITIQNFVSAVNFHKFNILGIGQMPKNLRIMIISSSALLVLVLGGWWSYKFKMVYLDAWPTDTNYNSVFMRMTASDAKPFAACKFIRDNEFSGKMFNYWTEGGFIAWGQKPDVNTGKTPLQLFMDGRAQAAYKRADYDVWARIMAGGEVTAQIVQRARMQRRRITKKEYQQIGKWLSEQMRKHDVWLVLMPAATYIDSRKGSYHFVRGFEFNPEWVLAFFNDKQKMFIDINNPKGKKVFESIIKDEIEFPDKFSEKLVKARSLFMFGKSPAEKEQGLNAVFEACDINPCQTAIAEIRLAAANYGALGGEILEFCNNYYDDFEANKDRYRLMDGYFHRLMVAINVSYIIRDTVAKTSGEQAALYGEKIKEYASEREKVMKYKRW